MTYEQFLQNKKHELGFSFRTRMVVQNSNYQEIQQFYNFCKNYDVDRIEYSKITDWKTWPVQEFKEHNIFDVTHPNHNDFLEKINQNFDYDKIDFGNLSEYKKS